MHFLLLFYLCSVIHAIRYSVITSADKAGVLVDGIHYPLYPTRRHSILFQGEAPIAHNNYAYVRTTIHRSEREPFKRHPINSDTYNEFFNRTWNQRSIRNIPRIYKPLKALIPQPITSLFPENYIPTIHFEASASKMSKLHQDPLVNDKEIKVRMTYIGLDNHIEFKKVKLELSGRSSRKMAKLSYKFKLSKKDRLFGYREFKLRSLFLDPSYLRERIGHDVAKGMGLASNQFSFVRVFMNGEALGLFGLIETFDTPWSAIVFGSEGNLYQGKRTDTLADLGYFGNSEAYHRGQYSQKQKHSNGLQPLIDFTRFIKKTSKSVVEWNKWLNVDSFLRSMALEVFLGFIDGYLVQANNFYLYQLPDTGQFIYIPYDMDSIMGITYFNPGDMLSGNYSDFPHIYSRPLMRALMNVPEFEHQFNRILLKVAQSNYTPRLHDLANMIFQDVEWDKTLPRKSTGYFSLKQNNPIDAMDTGLVDGVNPVLVRDFVTWLTERSVPFKAAVDGPTGHPSLFGVKEWLRLSSRAIKRFYRRTRNKLTGKSQMA